MDGDAEEAGVLRQRSGDVYPALPAEGFRTFKTGLNGRPDAPLSDTDIAVTEATPVQDEPNYC